MSKNIGKWDLQIGQWVKFSTTKDLKEHPLSKQQIYSDSRIFLVATREDYSFNPCRCFLIDEEGKAYDYCPRMNSLGSVDLLWDDNMISVFSDEEVEDLYGKIGMKSMYLGAKSLLEERKDYFSRYPAKKLDIDAKLEALEVDGLFPRAPRR